MPMTNRGKLRILQAFFRNTNVPAQFYLALGTSTITPSADTNTLSQVAEIAAGNGYATGGVAVARSAVAWDVLTEDDALDRAIVQAADVALLPTGGPIPATGLPGTYVFLLDDNPTPSSRDVLAYATLSPGPVSASDGQSITIRDFEFQAY